MLKPLLLSLAVSTMGVGAVGADPTQLDPATWRWSVSIILDAQRASARNVGALPAGAFGQRYERYSTLGLPEAGTDTNSR